MKNIKQVPKTLTDEECVTLWNDVFPDKRFVKRLATDKQKLLLLELCKLSYQASIIQKNCANNPLAVQKISESSRKTLTEIIGGSNVRFKVDILFGRVSLTLFLQEDFTENKHTEQMKKMMSKI